MRGATAIGMLGTGDGGGGHSQREVVLYAHTRPGEAMVEVENTRTVVTPEQGREWCQQAGTEVTVCPVLDLAAELATDVHDPTPTMREQVWARFPQCVHPSCERPSRGCDLDHRIPWPDGRTTTSNLYPLCRGHHRLSHRRPELPPHRLPDDRLDQTRGYRYLRHIR